MLDASLALELAYVAVEEALRLKASFADLRVQAIWDESVVVSDGRLAHAEAVRERGISVRVLVGGAWGFAAGSAPNRHDVGVLVRRATEAARAAAILQEQPVVLADYEAQRGVFRTAVERDPMGVPLAEKVELLAHLESLLSKPPEVVHSQAGFRARRTKSFYVSSDGAELEQDLVHAGIHLEAGAAKDGLYQRRSFPGGPQGLLLGRGWEAVAELELEPRATETAEDAVALLSAEPCPDGVGPAVLSGAVLAHHVGHGLLPLFALDRAMGVGARAGRGTFLAPADLGTRRLGSGLVHLVSDPRQRGGAGSYGFDDEGVAAERIELLSEGRVVGFLSSRETAARVGLERSQGSMRSSSWAEPPQIAAGNVHLEPGEDGDLEAIVADTERGILLDGPVALSLGHEGRSFLGTCELGWLIEDGQRIRRVRQPVYRGGTESFWQGCDRLGDRSVWSHHGVEAEGLVQGVGAPPGRFAEVEVSSGPPALVSHPEHAPLPIASRPSGRSGRDAASPPTKRLPRRDVK